MTQGALGDSWLVSALNLLAPFPELLKKVVVSDRHKDKGALEDKEGAAFAEGQKIGCLDGTTHAVGQAWCIRLESHSSVSTLNIGSTEESNGKPLVIMMHYAISRNTHVRYNST